MRSFWGYQLSQDPGSSFWEHVEPDGTPNLKQFSSLAHGWAAGPVISLTTQVLGVQPTDPGFSRYTVIPHPADLAWVQGRVPTPYGAIDVGWERDANGQFTMDISAPIGTTGPISGSYFGSSGHSQDGWPDHFRGSSLVAKRQIRWSHSFGRRRNSGSPPLAFEYEVICPIGQC
jgi:hypothetical protein